MADTCIVCLGELPSDPPPSSPTANGDPSQTRLPSHVSPATPTQFLPAPTTDTGLIAHILPCGHNLHDDCLRPWVERANSCPICRQNFNEVQLFSTLTSPPLSSYAVEDKRQEADLDPSIIIDDDDDLFGDAHISCVACDSARNEAELLICDGCNALWHTFCVGMDAVPSGSWFCPHCSEEGLHSTSPRSRRAGVRTREQQRLYPEPTQHTNEWSRVWQSIFRQTNIDLDYPFDTDPEDSEEQAQHRRDFEEWRQRFRVAERNGAGATFRHTASIAASRGTRGRSPTPSKESIEEIRAWNAFDKAREIQRVEESAPSHRRNKRKSATASPAEPQPAEPERKLKRPRTRAMQRVGDQSTERIGESSASANTSSRTPQATATATASEPNDAAPSFLSSLLKEVETSNGMRGSLSVRVPGATEISPPGSPSPLSSPSASAHPSPRLRAASPIQMRPSRPSSPPPLTSRIEPDYSRPVEHHPFSPSRVTSDSERESSEGSEHRLSRRRQKAPKSNVSSPPTHEISPSRNKSLTYDEKSEIQSMVKAALKPYWNKSEMTSEQYTNINRDISRLLYAKVEDLGRFNDPDEKQKWAAMAANEVDEATKGLELVSVLASSP